MTRYERLEYILLTVTSRMSHPREVEDLALAGPELLEGVCVGAGLYDPLEVVPDRLDVEVQHEHRLV